MANNTNFKRIVENMRKKKRKMDKKVKIKMNKIQLITVTNTKC